MSNPILPRDRMIVALDLADADVALVMVRKLGDAVSFYKIGMELTYAGGLHLVQRLVDEGKQVFLDLKLHDIPHTVEMATARIAHLGATYLTVHAYPQTMAAAHKGRDGSTLRILGVTILTSMTNEDVNEAGYGAPVADLVRLRARQAEAAKIDGIICSAADIAGIRGHVGSGFEIITPGIRLSGSAIGDQKRVMTPAEAIRAGADRLVIGRPIIAAEDPRGMVEAIVEEIAGA